MMSILYAFILIAVIMWSVLLCILLPIFIYGLIKKGENK